MLQWPGTFEWLIIGLVALLLFGKRLPDVANSLGRSYREFRRGLAGTEEEFKKGAAGEPPPSSPSATPPPGANDGDKVG